jgi:O-antigen ligase
VETASKPYAINAPVASRGNEASLDREKLDTWCERIILGLVVGVVGWSALATGAVRPQDFIIVQWLTVLILVVWAVRFAINPKHRLLWPWVCWPVLAFMGYAVIRYLAADVEYVARQEMIRVLIYGFLFLAALHNLYHQDATHLSAFILLGVAAVIGMYAVTQFVTDSDHVWHFMRPELFRQRGSGTFINPNNAAAFLGMFLPLGLAYALTSRKEYIGKILLGYASLVIFAGIVVSYSRWGWIASGVTLVVLVALLARSRDYLIQTLMTLAAFVLIMIVMNMLAPREKGGATRLEHAARAEDVRFKVWGPATQIWRDNFWLGAGPGHFDVRFRQYRPPNEALQVRPERVHNDYLNVLTDWGAVGGLLALAIVAVFYAEVFRSWKYVKRAQNDISTRRSNKSAFVLGGALGVAALLIHSFFDFNIYIPAIAIALVTLAALVAGHFRFATESYWHTVRWPLRIPVALVLLAAIPYLGAQTWKHTVEIARLNHAASDPDATVKGLEGVFAIEPQNAETAYRLGETLRLQSWQGGENYRNLAQTAISWFDTAMKLNPYDPYSRLRKGMCLHWLGRHSEAAPLFEYALKLDPNGYYTVAHMGWHFVQLKDWENAKQWFEKSLKLNSKNNPIATAYLDIVEAKLREPQETASAQN